MISFLNISYIFSRLFDRWTSWVQRILCIVPCFLMRFSCFLRGTRSRWVQPSGDGCCLPQVPWVTLSRSSVMKHQSPRPKLPTLNLRCLVRMFWQIKGLSLRCLVILGGLYMSQYVLFFQWFYWLEGTLLYKNHPWSEIEVVRISIFVESGRGIWWMFFCYPERNCYFFGRPQRDCSRFYYRKKFF